MCLWWHTITLQLGGTQIGEENLCLVSMLIVRILRRYTITAQIGGTQDDREKTFKFICQSCS